MNRLHTCAHGVVAALSCLVLNVSAQVGLPAGSYAQSCSDITSDGSTLRANCGNMAGNRVPASLGLPCVGLIGNNNGALICQEANLINPPAGDYQGSCQSAKSDGKNMQANCFTMAGTLNTTTLALPCPGNISNMNGKLACNVPVAAAPPPVLVSPQVGLPAGSYAQSCSDITSDGATLRANCGNMAGNRVPASLGLPCVGLIGNNNGALFCQEANLINPPAGDYQGSCQSAKSDGKNMQANCFTMAGTLNTTTLALPCPGNIANVNGKLSCNVPVAAPPPVVAPPPPVVAPTPVVVAPPPPVVAPPPPVVAPPPPVVAPQVFTPPSGDYMQTCSDVSSNGVILRANCATASGARRATILALPCTAALGNRDGFLTCNTGAGRYDTVQAIIDSIKKTKPSYSIPAGLSQLVGLFSITDIERSETEDQTQLFKLKGKANLNYAGGNSPFVLAIKRIGDLAKAMGLNDPVPVELTFGIKNGEADLALELQLWDGWRMTPVIDTGIVKTQIAIQNLRAIFHATGSGGGLNVSIETTGQSYVKPTERDPWLAVKPGIEFNNEAEISYGGEITGSCPQTPTESTNAQYACTGKWDIHKLNNFIVDSGNLKLKVNSGAVTGIEAAISKGRLVATSTDLEGAVIAEKAGVHPGAGLVLNIKQNAPLTARDFMKGLSNFVGMTAGHEEVDILTNLMPPNMNMEQGYVVLAPTGLVMSKFNFPDPIFKMKGQASWGGMRFDFDGSMKPDLPSLDGSSMRFGPSDGEFRIYILYDSVLTAVKNTVSQPSDLSAPLGAIASTLSLNSMEIIIRKNATTSGRVQVERNMTFNVQGKQFSMKYPGNPLDPVAVANAISGNLKENIKTKYFKEILGTLPGGSVLLNTVDKVFSEGIFAPVNLFCGWIGC